ncbi:MAG: DNA repair protein RadC [Candidatus Thiodiazotropha sp. (ex Lucinoma borealis)]|nr:DNA repair protein RadC [Candidatus Thiodiazotropha sp. (ex Lucinoma borealis)]
MAKQLTLPLSFVVGVDEKYIHHSDTDEQTTIEKALTILSGRHSRGEPLTSPEITKQFLRLKLGESYNEVFGCIFLDNRHRIIQFDDLFFGTVDGASVHPRVIVQKALFCNAAAAVLYHNHPSGVAEPSQADHSITKRITDALALIDVRVLDHLVVTTGECVSFAERGLL